MLRTLSFVLLVVFLVVGCNCGDDDDSGTIDDDVDDDVIPDDDSASDDDSSPDDDTTSDDDTLDDDTLDDDTGDDDTLDDDTIDDDTSDDDTGDDDTLDDDTIDDDTLDDDTLDDDTLDDDTLDDDSGDDDTIDDDTGDDDTVPIDEYPEIVGSNGLFGNDLFVIRNEGGELVTPSTYDLYDILSNPERIINADLNNDDAIDLVITGWHAHGISMLNNGDGTFTVADGFSIILYGGYGLAAGDFNEDGFADVVTTGNTYTDDRSEETTYTAALYLGVGDGTFQERVELTISGYAYSIVVDDFNEDGHADIVLSSSSAGANLSLLFGNGDGTFTEETLVTQTYGACYMVAADVNGDLHQDLIKSNCSNDVVTIVTGDGSGGFTEAETISTGDYPVAVAAGDFTGDATVDIAVINEDDGSLQIFANDGTKGYSLANEYALPQAPHHVVTADLDNNAALDLVISFDLDRSWAVYYGGGDGSFTEGHEYSVGSQATGAAVGDYNGDGLLDVAAIGQNHSDLLSIYFQEAAGGFRGVERFNVGDEAGDVAVGDINGDGWQDMVGLSRDVPLIRAFFGKGNGEFELGWQSTDCTSPYDFALADFNGDGHLDLIVVDYDIGGVRIFYNDGSGSFQPPVSHENLLESATLLAVADLNHDGAPDFELHHNGSSATLRTFLNDGVGNFVQAAQLDDIDSFSVSLFADFNNDAYPDLLIAGCMVGEFKIYLGQGDGTFQAGTSLVTVGYFSSADVSDVNNDGHLDVFACMPNGSDTDFMVLPGNGDGTFQAAVQTNSERLAHFAFLIDPDMDGILDLAVTFPDYSMGIANGVGNGEFDYLGAYDTRFYIGDEPIFFMTAYLNGRPPGNKP